VFSLLVRLYGPLFAHIKARFLIIEETPLATIEDYVFYGVNNTLEQLHLLRTNLSHVGPLGFGVRIILSSRTILLLYNNIKYLYRFLEKQKNL